MRGLRPEILIAWIVANDLCREYGLECYLTSGTEGQHGPGSFHPVGLAIDLRSKDFKPGELDVFVVKLKLALGGNVDNTKGEFDVIKESTHLHVEYDVEKVKAYKGAQ